MHFYEDFYFYGDFYRHKGLPCRSTLEIVTTDKGGSPEKLLENCPDVVVVMMNPGGSHPVEQSDRDARTMVEIGRGVRLVRAHPDNTQRAISRLMDAFKFEHVRILNLSDFREKNSSEVCRRVRAGTLPDGDSMFSDGRCAELNARLNPRTGIVVVAWSCFSALQARAADALERIRRRRLCVVGWEGNRPERYRHPSRVQMKWPREIERRIRGCRSISSLKQKNS